jgi:hypothetical protein
MSQFLHFLQISKNGLLRILRYYYYYYPCSVWIVFVVYL